MKNKETALVAVADLHSLESELEENQNAEFSTSMSPQELYALDAIGYEPVKVVVGTIVYSMGIRGIIQSVRRALTQGEMVSYSEMNQTARKLALRRMEMEAVRVGGDGVVGVTVDVREYADFLEVVAMGTAVVKNHKPQTSKTPEVVLGI